MLRPPRTLGDDSQWSKIDFCCIILFLVVFFYIIGDTCYLKINNVVLTLTNIVIHLL
jgi:hypothetical protein